MRLAPIMVLLLALGLGTGMTPAANARGGGGGHGGMSANAKAAEQSAQDQAPSSMTAVNHASTGKTNKGRIASALGALNATHASATARSHASARSRVGKIAAYDRAMLAALAMPTATPAEVAARNQAIANARATLLTAAANKPLTAKVVAVVDSRLGLPPSDPTLGVP